MASPEQFAARSRGRATAGARSKERGCTAADGADAGMRVPCQGGGRQLRVRRAVSARTWACGFPVHREQGPLLPALKHGARLRWPGVWQGQRVGWGGGSVRGYGGRERDNVVHASASPMKCGHERTGSMIHRSRVTRVLYTCLPQREKKKTREANVLSSTSCRGTLRKNVSYLEQKKKSKCRRGLYRPVLPTSQSQSHCLSHKKIDLKNRQETIFFIFNAARATTA